MVSAIPGSYTPKSRYNRMLPASPATILKPLTTGQKKFIYEKLVFGRLHLLAKPVYDLLIGCELGAERGMDMVSPAKGPDRTTSSWTR